MFDSAISTEKIADVAVSIEKTEDPVWTYAAEPPVVTDFALTTTAQEVISHTIDIPSWVGTISIDAQTRLQISNSSGGVQGAIAEARLNDAFAGAATDDVPNGSAGGAVKREVFQISTPGASVEISAYCRVSTGTNSANITTLHITAVGTR